MEFENNTTLIEWITIYLFNAFTITVIGNFLNQGLSMFCILDKIKDRIDINSCNKPAKNTCNKPIGKFVSYLAILQKVVRSNADPVRLDTQVKYKSLFR